MREMAIAGVWLFVSIGLFIIEADVPGDYLPYVSRGKWVALVLAVMNALRPAVKRGGQWLFRRLGWMPEPPATVEAPPKPVLHPELDFTDDRIQNPPPPPGSIRH